MREPADLILYNANVLTLDPQRPTAELVATKGREIVFVGKNADLEQLKGQDTTLIDCEGKAIVPGFNDAHFHLLSFASSLLAVDLSPRNARSISDIEALIAKRAQNTPEGGWIRGAGYNEFYLLEKRHPDRRDLDEAAPHHPVKLTHRSGHACVLNSLALDRVGISIETPEPPGGFIEREPDTGEPNGLLFEMDSYIDRAIPPLSSGELREGLRVAIKECLSCGITSIQDATSHNGVDEWRLFERLKQEGELPIRAYIMIGAGEFSDILERGLFFGYGDDRLKIGAVKIVLDETAGRLRPPQDELNQLVLGAQRAGFQVAIHAIEEGAIEAAAIALEYACGESPSGTHRHRIEHCSVCTLKLLGRLRNVHATIVTHPSFIYYSGERYLATVPEHEQRWLYRIGSFLENGLMTAAGSDCPVAPNNPVYGIYSAVTRRAETGELILPSEGIAPIEALRMYTSNAAYASFDEGRKGSISIGRLADMVILDQDPTRVPVEEIKEIGVEKTIIGGKVVWEA